MGCSTNVSSVAHIVITRDNIARLDVNCSSNIGTVVHVDDIDGENVAVDYTDCSIGISSIAECKSRGRVVSENACSNNHSHCILLH